MTAGDSQWASPRNAVVVGALTILLVAGAVPLAVLSNGQSSGLPMVPFGIVGFVVARRQPRNPIGWILLGLAFVFLLSSDAGEYAVMAYRQGYHLPLARPAVFVAGFWIWLIVLLPLPIWLFPDGRLSRRWRWVLWGYLAACATLVVSTAWRDVAGIFARRIRIDSTGELASTGSASGAVNVLFGVLFISFCLIAVVRQIINYRRASGVYRQQLKWLLSGGAVCLVGLVLTLTASIGFAFIAIMALPVGMGVGILKYRLYEIDRLISRTLSYGLLTTLLVGFYLGLVILTTRVLPFSSPVGVAASTLTAAALFNPLRRRIQRTVDHRFNRAHYDASTTVATFAMRLRQAVDLDTVSGELLHAADHAVEPSHASLWINPSQKGSHG